MNVKILKASISHAEAIAKTGKQSFRDAFDHQFSKADELREYLENTYSLTKIEKSITKPDNVYFVALNDNEVIGFAKMKIESAHKVIKPAKQSELQKIYILKEFHGTGAGKGLIDAVINQSKEIGTEQLWLDVEIHNLKAKRFYEKNGFSKVGDHSFVIGTQLFNYDVMAFTIKAV